ncbi:MAG: flavodoxin family protein [Methanobacteriaceae archaeon]|jgi:multimeric flavodoxin WrbA|nr:flavodoxin family protein [Candidatus Methanorudis spinitermitis]
MKTLILCDRESLSYEKLNLASKVEKILEKSKSEVETITLNGDEINPCKGCFKCWVKTPGLCIMRNDCGNTVARKEIQSDVVVFISKITYGGYSYDIKSFLDRSIPNISPFFEIVNGEMRHKMRYKRFPIMITIGYGPCTNQEYQTFINLAKHNALNMRPPKHFVFIMEKINELKETMESLKNVLELEISK